MRDWNEKTPGRWERVEGIITCTVTFHFKDANKDHHTTPHYNVTAYVLDKPVGSVLDGDNGSEMRIRGVHEDSLKSATAAGDELIEALRDWCHRVYYNLPYDKVSLPALSVPEPERQRSIDDF